MFGCHGSRVCRQLVSAQVIAKDHVETVMNIEDDMGLTAHLGHVLVVCARGFIVGVSLFCLLSACWHPH